MKLYFIYDPITDYVINGGDRKHAGYKSFKTAQVYINLLKTYNEEWKQKFHPNISFYRIVEVNIV